MLIGIVAQHAKHDIDATFVFLEEDTDRMILNAEYMQGRE